MSGYPGMGVMIGMLGGNEKTVESIKTSIGKVIREVWLKEDKLKLDFMDGTTLVLWDDGQSCCESRWMHTDADLPYYSGATLLDISVAAVELPRSEEAYDVHEAQFLHINTSKGLLDVVTHVDHNGYYGGFWIVANVVQPK